jgi:hypothetical protein
MVNHVAGGVSPIQSFAGSSPRIGGLGLLGWSRSGGRTSDRTMRDVAEYRKCAEDCRKRAANLASQSHHLEAFLEMAQTWEQLADLHELSESLRSSGVLLQAPPAGRKNS